MRATSPQELNLDYPVGNHVQIKLFGSESNIDMFWQDAS